MSLAEQLKTRAAAPDKAAAAWQLTLTNDYADVETGALNAPLDAVADWDGVLRHFGLDPAVFEVVDDTVKMSRWQQSRRLDNGDRDTIWLHAYKARFRRVTNRVPDADVAALTKRVHAWKPAKRAAKAATGEPCTMYVGWADWQLGKAGTATAQARVLESFQQVLDRVRDLRRIGRNITSLAVWNMGDPIEGCDGNYASQLHTTELNRRQQLNLALDLWATGLRAFAPHFDDIEFGTVLCNHGEWARAGVGTKPTTGDSDNASGYLADTLRRVFADRDDYAHIRWVIPHDEMTVTTLMNGVPVALAHGHKAPSGPKEIDWLRGQSIRVLRDQGVEPRLWMTAHRHHYEVKDYGPWTRIQHPALDTGSKWYEDTSGHWSTPGTFTCLVGQHPEAGGPITGRTATGFSDEMVLLPSQ